MNNSRLVTKEAQFRIANMLIKDMPNEGKATTHVMFNTVDPYLTETRRIRGSVMIVTRIRERKNDHGDRVEKDDGWVGRNKSMRSTR